MKAHFSRLRKITAYVEKRDWIVFSGLFFAVGIIYLRVVKFPFIDFDDNINLHLNSNVQHFNWQNLKTIWTQAYGHLYAPLTYTVWMALFSLSRSGDGLSPFLFHLTNLIFFLLTVGIVFEILKRLTKSIWGAVAGALLFALHPVQIESVAWVTGLKGVLSGFFFLLSFYLYVLFCQCPKRKKNREVIYYGLSCFTFLLSVFAKGTSVVLPVWLMVVGYFLLKRKRDKVLKEMIPYTVIALGFIGLTIWAHPEPIELSATFTDRFLISFDALFRYLTLFFFPTRLAFDYGYTLESVLQSGSLYLRVVGTVAVMGLVYWHYKRTRRPWLMVGSVLFLITLLPICGFRFHDWHQFSSVADRFLYLSLFGPALYVAWVASKIRTRSAFIAVSFAVLFGLGLLTTHHLKFWSSNIRLFARVLEVNSQSWLAYGKLGDELVRRNENQAALEFYQRAFSLHPTASECIRLGQIYFRLANYTESAAAFEKASYLKPNSAPLAYDLGRALMAANRVTEAKAVLLRSTQLAPDWEPPQELLKSIGKNPNRRTSSKKY